MDDPYSSSSIDDYFSRPVEFNDESFLSSSLTSVNQPYFVEITELQNVNALNSHMPMTQPYFENRILESQGCSLDVLPQMSASQLYLEDKTKELQDFSYQSSYEILEDYYRENYENKISELPTNFSDQQDEVLESQNPACESSLSIHLVDVTDNDNLPLDIQSDTDDIHLQENELGNEHLLELVQAEGRKGI
ncbi:10324_t:CDS:2 [Cetraspora pellucida]|uniref:10324_t:CDS:1 n=1 Tax=Cetraspora pellucida TaxID=1433469 RepID=A0ACA9JW84_9GLOM|nr:10324_t:CDS:2 [Cetraspora pellucida]